VPATSMTDGDGNVAAANFPRDDPGTTDTDADASLRFEIEEAAGAMVAHIRKVAATATTEAELSVASIAALVAAALAALQLLLAGWLCLVAAGTWWAVAAGLPLSTALLIAGAINIAAVLLLLLWGRRLLRNIGFSRTRKLVFPGSQ
jgi:hypothetical protein